MSDISDESVRRTVEQALSSVRDDIARLKDSVGRVEGRLTEVHQVNSEVQRLIASVDQLTRGMQTSQDIDTIRLGVEDIRQRVFNIERGMQETVNYLRERHQQIANDEANRRARQDK